MQSSLKIIVPNPFNVNERDECSLQGTHPTTKRPMLFKGKILAVFGKFNNVFHFTLIMFLTAGVWEICFICFIVVNTFESFDFKQLFEPLDH